MALGTGPIPTNHADKFRCIGSACEDTCCVGWQVTVDRGTYDTYRNMTESPLYPQLNRCVQSNPESKSDRDFAHVELGPECRCPFLSPERLCAIQIEHGVEALSSICAEYPRASRWIDGQQETSLSLSCPEAARIVLLDRNFLRPSGTPSNPRKHYQRFAATAARLPSSNRNPFQYFWPVRELTFMLLQDRTYPLWQRLFIVGMFCRRLTNPGRHARSVPDLLRSYAEIMAQEKLRCVIERIPPRQQAQLSLLIQLVNSLNGLNALPDRFLSCLRDCLAGLGCFDGAIASAPTYEAAYLRYFAPFAARRGYIFENYLLSYVVRKRFPYGDDRQSEPSENPLIEFTLMALRFALIKGVMIGMAGLHKESLTPDHLIQLVQSFEKGVEHCAAARAEIVRCIRAGNLDCSDGIAMMLRN